jgi:UDP-N-acetylglucosamine diphosphorylase/glucosamine-1-phosphate N-acetyltransferase
MNVVLFDLPEARIALKPFTFTRPIAKLRLGIATIEEKWKWHLPGTYSYLTCNSLHLEHMHAVATDTLYINATICPDCVLAEAIAKLKPQEVLTSVEGVVIAFRIEGSEVPKSIAEEIAKPEKTHLCFCGEIVQLKHKWDLFLLNAAEIEKDWKWYTKGRVSKPILDDHTAIYNEKRIFIDEGVSIKAAILNAESGCIYIGKNVSIAEGSVLKGPLAICSDVHVGMHTELFEGTTIGPGCTIQGTIGNSILFGYNNTRRQSSLYRSILGEWCNIAAGANFGTTYPHAEAVQVWDFEQEAYAEALLDGCGSFVGDYSQVGANVDLEAGTVVGIASYLNQRHANTSYIPSFVCQDKHEHTCNIPLEQAIEQIKQMLHLHHQTLSQKQVDLLTDVFAKTATHRIKALI